MSEVTLLILDSERAIHGRVHGCEADRAVAALAAEPETIEELDVAMRRFESGGDRPHFAHFRSGDDGQPWDAGIVVIDLAARLIAGDSCYSALTTQGSVFALSQDGDSWDQPVDYRLSEDWLVVRDFLCWKVAADERRKQRAATPRIDSRSVLFGRPMLEFIAQQIEVTRNLDATDAVRKVHADWLMTSRNDLGGRSPREVLLAHKEFINWDLQLRCHQWTFTGKCPPPLFRDTAAYRDSGFGTHQIVVYYDLMRFLLGESRARIEQDASWNRADEMLRLERLRDEWLETPEPEFHGRTPASLIDNERRRMPESLSGAEAMVDPDCPCCQMMADDSFGPAFWGLDGSNMDEDFAFSFHQTVEEWEAELREWEEFNREFDRRWAERERDRATAERIWTGTFINDGHLDDLPLGEFVPVALFGFAAMVGELNQDLLELLDKSDTAQSTQETLNRLLGNLQSALQGSPELIDPALDRLVEELTSVAEEYPTLGEKCADLSRRLQEFPEKLAASAERGDIPF